MAINFEPTIQTHTVASIFTKHIAKVIPLAFDDSMSYYECICAFRDYLNTVIIPNVNNVNDAVAELQTLYLDLQNAVNQEIERFETATDNEIDRFETEMNTNFNNLHDFVDNYFENNFPALVSSTLDEMAEDGTLENLLNDSAHLTKSYDTYTDMISDSEHFTNGLRLKTLGYYSINDGGGADYYVNNSVIATNYQIELENDLYLNLILKNNTLNIKQLGAKGDDSFDNTDIFTNALSSNYKTIFIPTGTYQTGVLSFNNKNIKGENNTYLKCNTSCTDWITIGNSSIVENIRFNGNELADTVKIATTDPSANLFNIKNCLFYSMNKSGLTSNGIDAIISGCVFKNNKENGLRINQVGNIVENCYSYLNDLNGILIGVGTNITSNCKVYKNKTWGYYIDNSNANAHYITIDNCESQENGSGSLYLSAGTRNCIIDNLSSLGESDITTGGIAGRTPVIHNEGSYNKITAVVTPFHIYAPNEWYGYPTSLLFIGHGTNNDIKITCTVISSEYEQLKTLYPSLTYQELTFIDNIGQSNKVIINNVDVQNKISVLNSNSTTADVRGDILGNKTDNCVFVAKPSFVNSLATETIYTYGQYETSLSDDSTIQLYQSGIVYPLNYKDYFKACVRIDIVGTVNGQEVVRTGGNQNEMLTNTNENLYKSFVIPYVQYITSQTGYEAGSLKIITRIMCQKTSAITITEPLYLACKNICLLNDLQ